MNKQVRQLLQIAEQPTRLIVGLMSGTSLDGLDIALCECGTEAIRVKEFKTVEYDPVLRKRIGSIQSRQEIDLERLCVLNTELAHYYAEKVSGALQEWGVDREDVDLIASHGQTVYHRPDDEKTSTLQIVDGDHIAHKTGIITISDFRQKHTAAGGQGAPLAAFMDEHLFRDDETHRVLLNLGGIANFTWLPCRHSGRDILTSDTGPANTLINQAMQHYFDQPFDKDGETAASGKVDSELLKYLLLEPYFRKPFPKTTGQEEFNLELVEKIMQGYRLEVSPEDFIATLTKLTYKSIERAFDSVIGDEEYELYVSGGGIHNPVIMQGLKDNLANATIRPFEELGMPPDAKEAALMAFLANEFVMGRTFEVNGKEVSLGKVSL
jgi:anhydro-N-acetylmuramic acid kinase